MTVQKWDSLYIYCFSGTGNALASSVWIADEAEKRGIKTVLQQIDKENDIRIPGQDENPLIGFTFPTHGFNAAPIMLRFIAGFPQGSGKEVFVLNTRAGMKLSKIFLPGLSGLALMIPAFILQIKGYKCIGFRPVDLPSNWIPLHPGLKARVIESIFKRCEVIVRNFAAKIFSGKKVWRGLFSIPIDLLISPLAAGYYIGGRFFLSKTFIANTNCNNCDRCVKECPTSSIKIVNNRPYWKLTCESCMRCLNNCPEKAIEAAHGLATGFMLIITAINTRLMILIIDALKINPDVWWWKLLSQIVGISVMVLIATFLYRIVHLTMEFKSIRFLIRYTSLTTYPFWRRYNYPNSHRKSRNPSDKIHT